MTTQEIKDIFGVDISKQDTRRHVNNLKTIFITNNQHIKTSVLAKELNITPQSVRRYIVLYDNFKTKKGFEEMRMAFASKDRKMFDLAVAASVDSKEVVRQKTVAMVKRYKLIKRQEKPNFVLVKGGAKRVSDAMRAAKISEHPLLNKIVQEYTQKDLNELINIENETNTSKSNGTMVVR